ncbi:hypothetical protein SUGI_0684490 [Cryptomeria japonica]|nr:hypothetical protein SUGI_0684490 [Cryptomeria japonica]
MKINQFMYRNGPRVLIPSIQIPTMLKSELHFTICPLNFGPKRSRKHRENICPISVAKRWTPRKPAKNIGNDVATPPSEPLNEESGHLESQCEKTPEPLAIIPFNMSMDDHMQDADSEDNVHQIMEDELDIVDLRSISQSAAKLMKSEPVRKQTGRKTNKQKQEEDAQTREQTSIRSYLTRSNGVVTSLGGQ